MIVIVFAFAFGLSMDYEVFLLARIKEYRRRLAIRRTRPFGTDCNAAAGSSPRRPP